MRSWFSISLLLLALACLWGAARAHRPLLAWRVGQTQEVSAALDRSPPLVVFTTVAIGGFRGMLADLLWMRAIRLQEQDKVFEMAQLADWISKLEPRFVTVWAFNAWNLAYNISIRFPEPEDRWRWVEAGIRLLRDGGLAYNPRSATLCHELAWIYQHKIGFYLDPAHRVYKCRLAQDMAALFDGPRPEYHSAGSDPRLLQLKADTKLEPARMEALDRERGPFDWRTPAAHAAYWAERGRACAVNAREKLVCDHLLCQCLAESFRHGRLVLDPGTGLYLATPDLAFLPRTLQAYAEARAEHPDEALLRFSYANFLGEAAVILFAYGRLEASREVYRELARLLPPGVDPGYEVFLLGSLRFAFDDPPLPSAPALAEGFWVQAYAWAALGEDERAAAWERLAVLFWERVLAVCPDTARWERFGLAPLEIMRREAWRRAVAEAPDVESAVRLMQLAPGEEGDQ